VEVFDQQIATARPIGQKRADLFERLRVELSAFRRTGRTTAAAAAGGGLMFNDAHRSSLLKARKTRLNRYMQARGSNRIIDAFYQYDRPTCIFSIMLP
jgi:hypothetical protein